MAKATDEEIQSLRDEIAKIEERLEQHKAMLSEATGGESEFLKPITFRDLTMIDDGRPALEFDRCVTEVMENISRYPCVISDGEAKVSARKISMTVEIKPIIKMNKEGRESANQAVAAIVPRIDGLELDVVVNKGIPSFKTTGVRVHTKLRNGKITGAFFNPHNNESPLQREFDFDEDSLPCDDD